MIRTAVVLAVALAALSSAAATKVSVGESFTAGSGPYIGNSFTAGVSPDSWDFDVGYDFGSDENLVLYHELWGSIGYWPGGGFRVSIDGYFGPRTSSTTAGRGFFSLESKGFGGTLSWHPGRSGDTRPYLEAGASYDQFDVSEAAAGSLDQVVNAGFSQTAIRGAIGVDIRDTAVRLGGTKYFNGADASAVNLPPGVGGGPEGVGAISGALPTRVEDWAARGSIRQLFGPERDWDVQIAASYGSYVADDGNIEAVTLRLGHKFGRVVRGHLGVTGQLEQFGDVIGGGTRTSVFANAGVTFVF
jgi:hypothetical protein